MMLISKGKDMDLERRLERLEGKLAFQRKLFLILSCVALAMGTLAFIGPFAPPDPEAYKIETANQAAAPTTRLQISGNEDVAKIGLVNSDVGIGSATPSQKLDVSGSAKVSGFVELQNQGSDPAAGGADTQRLYTASDNLKFRLANGTIRQVSTLDGAETLTNKSLLSTGGNTIDATKLQTRNIAGTAPADGQVLKWNAATSQWEPAADTGGGGSASGTLQLVASATAASATSMLEITGLNGDVDEEYLIRVHIVTTATGSTDKNYLLRVNGDTGATSYLYTILQNNGVSSLSLGQSQTSGINLGTVNVDGQHVMTTGWFRAKKDIHHRELNATTNIGAITFRHIVGEWTNITSNVTSLRVQVAQGTTSIGQGSTVKVYRQVP